MASTTEFVRFKLIHMSCCGQLLCWVNPRFPNHCPECGKRVSKEDIKAGIMASDDEAQLRLNVNV